MRCSHAIGKSVHWHKFLKPYTKDKEPYTYKKHKEPFLKSISKEVFLIKRITDQVGPYEIIIIPAILILVKILERKD